MAHLRKSIGYFRRRFALSPAEEYVATFVVCVIAAGILLRIWNTAIRPAHPPVPREFGAIDSVFTARSAPEYVSVSAITANGNATAVKIFSAERPAQRKTFPPLHSVNINTAPPEALEQLPMIGPAMAARIIVFRANTPFMKVEDIQRVKGIGRKKFARIEPYLKVE